MVTGLTRDAIIQIIDYVSKATELISDNEKDSMIDTLLNSRKEGRKIFVIGAGRSGLVAKAFAMRLMHMDFDVYVVGETIMPPMKKGDVLIAISGSGRTRTVVSVAEAAKSIGAKVIALTTYPDSPLAKLADIVVRIPGRTKLAIEEDYIIRQVRGHHEPLAPLGTLFEVTTLVFLDGVVVELMSKLGITEEDMKERHANIE
ncbi:MAG: 6-phospho-3-hexuloisomerase [Desulfurococcaceae archaeon]|mgnify:CR=1 FL=1|jgi:6-phospho-3-hexuloisomerase